jgi:DNA-binding response OmpR family regulator
MAERKVLCVSFDKTVSDSRCAVLRQGGYAVTAITTTEEALQLLGREKFDLVVIGHRFPKAHKQQLAAQAREQGKVPVLLVCGASADTDIPAEARVYALEGAEGLLAAVRTLLPASISAPAA